MRPLVQIAALIAIVSLPGTTSADWPSFRGPRSANVFVGETSLGESSAITLEVVWKHELGSGYSAVSVADGHAVTLFSDGQDDLAVAFDAATGRELWRARIAKTHKGHNGSHDGPISTPLIAGERVVALGPLGDLVGFDLRTGERAWATHLQELDSMRPLYGYGSSPILVDGVVVVQVGAAAPMPGQMPPPGGFPPAPTVIGLDPEDGSLLWKVGERDTVNYQSPMTTSVAGRDLVLVPTDRYLYGIVAESGDVLWNLEHGGEFYAGAGTQSMNPVALGDDHFFVTDANDSSSVVKLTGTADGQMELQKVWSGRSIRSTYTVPIAYEGNLYGYNSRFLTAVDAMSGEMRWRSRQPGDGSLIVVDGHLVILTKKGRLHIAKATPEAYQEIAALDVVDLSWTAPSFADGKIFVRGLGAIAAVKVTSGRAETKGPAQQVAGERFNAFLKQVAGSDAKKEVVDQFLSEQASMPLIESSGAADEVIVHFLYRGDAHDMGIAGDMIASRQEEPMIQVEGTDLFYYSTRLQNDAHISYHLIKDFEERMVDPRNPNRARDFMGEVSWAGMPGWQAPTHLSEAAAERQGRVESIVVDSQHFPEPRKVDVYLPPGYDKSEDRYPVAYVHAGKAALGLGGWKQTLDHLIGRSVSPMIAVFIETTGGRGEELVFFQRDAYAAMLAEEIVPTVDERYRTLATAESRANVGAGMAGCAAIYSAFRRPGLVGKVASQSTFLLTLQAGFLAQVIGSTPPQPLSLLMEWGAYDQRSENEAWDFRLENQRLAEMLRARGYDVSSREVPEGSGWASWRNRTDDLLEWLFPLGE